MANLRCGVLEEMICLKWVDLMYHDKMRENLSSEPKEGFLLTCKGEGVLISIWWSLHPKGVDPHYFNLSIYFQ